MPRTRTAPVGAANKSEHTSEDEEVFMRKTRRSKSPNLNEINTAMDESDSAEASTSTNANHGSTEKDRYENAIVNGFKTLANMKFSAQAEQFYNRTSDELKAIREENDSAISRILEHQDNNLARVINNIQAKSNQDLKTILTEINANTHEQINKLWAEQRGVNNSKETSLDNIVSQNQQMTQLMTELVQSLKPDIKTPGKDIKKKSSKTQNSNSSIHKPSMIFSDGSDSETEDQESDKEDIILNRTSSEFRGKKPNLPPFNGKETWKVWFTRFQDIAQRRGWSKEEKLDELIPRLQGDAGNFVFDQLSTKDRNNYDKLCKELTNRFRSVENPKKYGTMFATRKQKSNETVEAYANDLKKLYDKAHPKRHHQIRDEDLVRKFFEGLADSKASYSVEFAKDPQNIDEAVDEVINFQEVRRKPQKSTRKIQVISDSSSDESDNESTVIKRAPGKPVKINTNEKNEKKEEISGEQLAITNTLAIIQHKLEEMDRRTTGPYRDQSSWRNSGGYQPPSNTPPRWGYRPPINTQPNRNNLCFNCGQRGHYYKSCPFKNQETGSNTMRKTPNWTMVTNDSNDASQKSTPASGNGMGPAQQAMGRSEILKQ